ncbi:MAG: hybrid sensor histidine kinase/response regulator, partial [Gammaproteobacteria bacterium]|nr:hybrid sensor histidine kinase/response regulator [Gammaproteobacteria bacterium]
MSFRLKTILGIAIIEIVLLASLIFSGLAILKQTNEEQLQRRVKEVASLFQSASRDAIITTDVATLQDLVRNLLNNHDVLYVRIHGANGNVLAQDGIPDLLDRPFKEDVLINYVDDNIFDSRTDVIVSGEKFGEIEFGMPTNFISQTVDSAG